MSSQMQSYIQAWSNWTRERNALADKMLALVKRTDARFDEDENLRQSELKNLQHDFYKVIIADKLINLPDCELSAPADLIEAAETILNKRGHVKGRNDPIWEMRSAEEERLVNTVRVRWHLMLKKAGVRAADPRGSHNN